MVPVSAHQVQPLPLTLGFHGMFDCYDLRVLCMFLTFRPSPVSLRTFLWHVRCVQRLEAVTRSPVYSQLSETLDGLVTIRAFSTQRKSFPPPAKGQMPPRICA